MKEICGFLDKEGNFHKTEKECENANLSINIRVVEHTLDNFSSQIGDYLFKNYKWSYEASKVYSHNEDDIKKMISYLVLKNGDEFIELINKKKELEVTLDKLRKTEEYKNKWWMKVIWWK